MVCEITIVYIENLCVCLRFLFLCTYPNSISGSNGKSFLCSCRQTGNLYNVEIQPKYFQD